MSRNKVLMLPKQLQLFVDGEFVAVADCTIEDEYGT